MAFSRPLLLWALFTSALLLVLPGRSLAQTDNTARARAQFEAGVTAARAERWEEARRAFEESYRLSPRPATLLNLAGAQAHTAHPVEAARNYRQFLATADGVAQQVRDQAQAALAAVEEQIGLVDFTLENVLDEDVVLIDGLRPPREALADAVPIEPGQHGATVVRDGTQLIEERFNVRAGQRVGVTLALPETLPDPVEHEDPDYRCARRNPNRETDCPEFYGHRRSHSVVESPWFWVGVAGAVAVTVVIVVVATSGTSQDPYQGNLNPGSIQF